MYSNRPIEINDKMKRLKITYLPLKNIFLFRLLFRLSVRLTEARNTMQSLTQFIYNIHTDHALYNTIIRAVISNSLLVFTPIYSFRPIYKQS